MAYLILPNGPTATLALPLPVFFHSGPKGAYKLGGKKVCSS